MARTVLITGASRGIGRAAAIAFAKEGWQVGVNYNESEKEAHSLVREITALGGVALAVKADVSFFEQAQRLVETVSEKLGHIEVLINNAGISVSGLVTELPPPEWLRVFSVNCDGTYFCTRSVLPAMLKNHSGCIINVASIWGLTGAACETAYSASKGAVIAFSKALAKEVGPSGIRVNCIAPGVIDTEMNAEYSEQDMAELARQTPLNRIGSPQEIADLMLFLASEKAAFITGQVISPNGGLVI